MNNDLTQFSEERLKKIAFLEGSGCVVYQANEVAALARIALAAKQAKPIGYLENGKGFMYEPRHKELIKNPTPVYATPQSAHTEQDGWKLVPIEPTQEMVDAHISGMQSAGFSRAYRDMLAAAPKPDGTLISEGTKNDSCQWNRDEDLVYSTGCGNEWQFTEGGIEDNKIKFCPYCSGKIAAPKPESE